MHQQISPIEVMLRHIEELIEIHDDPARSGFLLRGHPKALALLREVRASLEGAQRFSLSRDIEQPCEARAS